MTAPTRKIAKGLILHDDHEPQGQFTARALTTKLAAYGIQFSWETVGDCFDDAMIEAFWGRTQTELLNNKKGTTVEELSAAMADCIENCHNNT